MNNIELLNKTVLVTGAAGFIGSNLVLELLRTQEKINIIGIDNMNDYYDVSIKEYRLDEIKKEVIKHSESSWTFIKGNIADKELINKIFAENKPQIVVNLAAQAGVRYSITNPDVYIESNLIGFYNILEACRHSYDNGETGVEHLVYASSSSVYGSNKKVPYSTDDKVDNPVSSLQHSAAESRRSSQAFQAFSAVQRNRSVKPYSLCVSPFLISRKHATAARPDPSGHHSRLLFFPCPSCRYQR